MTETLELQRPAGRVLSAHLRRQAFHRDIEAKAAALRSPLPPVVAPAPTWESVAPTAKPALPSLSIGPYAKPCWFEIIGATVDRSISMREIKQRVCDFYGVRHSDLVSHRVTKDLVMPRHVAMYLCKELTLRSLPDVGRQFSDRDHTTVLYAVQKITRLLVWDRELADTVAHIRNELEIAAVIEAPAASLPEGVPLEVCTLFERLALELVGAGFARYSADAILHRIRWEMHVERSNRAFVANNNWTAPLARWFLARNPSCGKFFELRERMPA